MHDSRFQTKHPEVTKINAAIGKRFVKLDHERLVLRPNRTNGDSLIVDLSLAKVLDGIWPDCRSWQIRVRHARIVQNNSRIERDDLFGRNDKRIDVDLLDPALFDDQLAEAHKKFFERGKIDSIASAKTFQCGVRSASVPSDGAPACD